MSRADGVLRVVLTGRWFDMIESGEKREEYRGIGWAKKLICDGTLKYLHEYDLDAEDMFCRDQDDSCEKFTHPYHTLVASRGDTARTLTRKIRRIRWGLPRPEWSGDTVTGPCFVIELEL